MDVKHHIYLLTCVTKSGRVWRKVPESDARSVGLLVTVLSPGEGCGGRSGDGNVCTGTKLNKEGSKSLAGSATMRYLVTC